MSINFSSYLKGGSLPVAAGGTGTTTSTGTGSVVLSNSPTLVTPALGAASATSLTLSTALTVANGGTGVATLTGIVKGSGTSAFTAAVSGTDYLAPPIGTSILKANSGGALANAVSGTDYSAGTSALSTGILKSTTSTGALTIAVAADFPTLNQNTTGTATYATNIAGGAAGNVSYQSGAGATAFVTNGSSGQVLTSNGTSAPSWTTISGGATITNDTSTNASLYPVFTSTTSGTMSAASVSNTKLYFNPSTGVLNATLFNSLSDINFKTNITPIVGAVDVIKQIDAVEYNWKDNGKHGSGVIAQQLEEVLPFLVDTGAEGEKSVNYSGLIGYLIGAVKELSLQVEELRKNGG